MPESSARPGSVVHTALEERLQGPTSSLRRQKLDKQTAYTYVRPRPPDERSAAFGSPARYASESPARHRSLRPAPASLSTMASVSASASSAPEVSDASEPALSAPTKTGQGGAARSSKPSSRRGLLAQSHSLRSRRPRRLCGEDEAKTKTDAMQLEDLTSQLSALRSQNPPSSGLGPGFNVWVPAVGSRQSGGSTASE